MQRPISTNSASARQDEDCASATRRSPGVATSTIIATRGRSCAAPTTPNIGLILDSFHTLARKIDVDSIRSIPKDRIFIVQVADAPLIDMDLLYWSRHFRNMPGEGDLPVREFMQAVAATGYDGYLSLEIFNDQFRGGSPKAISVDGHRSLKWLMDQVGRERTGARRGRPEHARPRRRRRRRVHRVLRQRSRRRRNCRRCCKAWASARSGGTFQRTSRSGGRAASIFSSTPSARGLRIRHSSSTARRSTRSASRSTTHARRWSARRRSARSPSRRRCRPGELVIPAIRGVGGSVIYFLDSRSELARCLGREFGRRRGRGWRGRRADPHRPCRPDDESERDAVMAAVLHGDIQHAEDADGRRDRPGRHRPQPGDRNL